jgi:hypothetical protein
MAAAPSGDCSASLTAVLADLDQHPGITWTAAGREYAASTLAALCDSTPPAPITNAEDSAPAEEESSLFGLKVEKAPADSAGRKRLKKTH